MYAVRVSTGTRTFFTSVILQDSRTSYEAVNGIPALTLEKRVYKAVFQTRHRGPQGAAWYRPATEFHPTTPQKNRHAHSHPWVVVEGQRRVLFFGWLGI